MKKPDRLTKSRIRTAADELAVSQGCWFDPDAAERPIRFISKNMVHPHGPLYGKPYNLIEWQADEIFRPLFGWRKPAPGWPNGKRRFTKAFIEVPKKNNKSGACAALANYLLAGEGGLKRGKRIYSAAADRDQASLVFDDARTMWGPRLDDRVRAVATQKQLHFDELDNRYDALSCDADTAEGLRIFGLIFDEIHVQKSRAFFGALRYGMAAEIASDEPIMAIITTAGLYEPSSIGWEQHDYAKKILSGEVLDVSEYSLIYAADDEDDWTAPETFAKANPSLGITISMDEMISSCEEAKQSPVAESEFRRYRLNQWVQTVNRYLDASTWAKAGLGPLPDLTGRRCVGGLDLGSRSDLSALVWLFEPLAEGEPWLMLPRIWVPESVVQHAAKHGNAQLAGWARQGLVIVTPGDAVDYAKVIADIQADQQQFDVRRLAFDRWNAEFVMQLLTDSGLDVVDFKQCHASYNQSMRELPKWLSTGKLAHDSNAIMTWMAGNVIAHADSNGRIKPQKENKDSIKKIDGIVALLMALDLALRGEQEEKTVYSDRGILSL